MAASHSQLGEHPERQHRADCISLGRPRKHSTESKTARGNHSHFVQLTLTDLLFPATFDIKFASLGQNDFTAPVPEPTTLSSALALALCRARRRGLEAPPPDPRLVALTAFQRIFSPEPDLEHRLRDPARCARRCAFRQSPPGILMHLQARAPHIGSRAVLRIYAHSGISQSGLTCQRSLVQVQYRPPNNSRTSAATLGNHEAALEGVWSHDPPATPSRAWFDLRVAQGMSITVMTDPMGSPAQPEPSSASHQSRTDSVVSVY